MHPPTHTHTLVQKENKSNFYGWSGVSLDLRTQPALPPPSLGSAPSKMAWKVPIHWDKCGSENPWRFALWIFPALGLVSSWWAHLDPRALPEWENLHTREAPHLPSDYKCLRVDPPPDADPIVHHRTGSLPQLLRPTAQMQDLFPAGTRTTCLLLLPQEMYSSACQKPGSDPTPSSSPIIFSLPSSVPGPLFSFYLFPSKLCPCSHFIS